MASEHDDSNNARSADEISAAADNSEEMEVEEGPPPTPFDHPLFLPILLAAGAVWFGRDGWFNPDIESVMFNRVGFGGLLAGAIYYGYKAKKEMDAERASKADSQPES